MPHVTGKESDFSNRHQRGWVMQSGMMEELTPSGENSDYGEIRDRREMYTVL